MRRVRGGLEIFNSGKRNFQAQIWVVDVWKEDISWFCCPGDGQVVMEEWPMVQVGQ
jgi:hypothetical protein